MAPGFLRSAGAGKRLLDLALTRCRPLDIDAAVDRRYALDVMRHRELQSVRTQGGSGSLRSDDFKIAVHFPVSDRLAEFALLPFPGRGVVVDERVAEQLARRPGRLEALRRIPEGARQLAPSRLLFLVGVACDRFVGLDAMFDAPEARSDRCGERDIRIDVGRGDPILD